MSEQEKKKHQHYRNSKGLQYEKSRILVMNIGTVGASRGRRLLGQGPLIDIVFLQCVSFLAHVLIVLPSKRDKQRKLKAACFFSG